MSVLVIAEHDNKVLNAQTYQVITGALKLSSAVSVLILGDDCQSVSDEAATIDGVSTVIELQNKQFKQLLAEDAASTVKEYVDTYQAVIAPATTFGKNFMPRLAALCDSACISDVIDIVSEDTFKRPIYAGNIIETVKALDEKKFITLRATAFDRALNKDAQASINKSNVEVLSSNVSFISLKQSKSDRPDLMAARVVVSGGRGLQNKENFQLIESLADALGAAVGASRAAVDAGFIANDHQVGQTGKVIAPELYIAVGISGAIQHVAGMKDAKVIVAINKDEDAPIFQIADYGLKGDLFEIVPELISKLKG